MFDCSFKNNCPYLNNHSTSEVFAEKEYWKKRVEYMEQIMKLAEEKIKERTLHGQEIETEKKDGQEELN
jgi:hypothetical protein